MMYHKKSVGYVQISLGIMLIFACFIGYDILRNHADNSYFWVDYTINKVFHDSEISLTNEQMITSLQMREYSMVTTGFVIQSFVIIIFIMAIMMILQGVANTKSGNKDSAHPKEMVSFMTVLFMILCLLAAAYFLIFKSHDKVRDGGVILLVLSGLLIVCKLFGCKKLGKKREKATKQADAS
ncbi:hypothetical protein JXB28_03495 [Candidatus Woesearchaeota archaeon]|nr:hypothetical protein [Candidatus Woesearchaeota archaeon]